MKSHQQILLLLLALTLLFSSCLQIEPIQPPTGTSEPTTAGTEAVTRPVWIPQKPIWSAEQMQAAAEALLHVPTEGIVDISKQAYPYNALQADLHALSQNHPAIFSYQSIGSSVVGRSIYLAVLGNPNAPHQILVTAGIHGREYMTSQLVMKQIEFYLTHYQTGSYNGIPYAQLFENYCFYIIPMVNPDGVMLAQEGLSSLITQEQKQIVQDIFENSDHSYKNEALYYSHWKANANGVDLNRNFDALWQQYAGAAMPSSYQYKGPYPASEPETRAVVQTIEQMDRALAMLCIHSQGEVLYWNCGQPDPDRSLRLTEAISARNHYEIIYEQNNDASLSDWCELARSIPAITVEIGKSPGNLVLPIDEFASVWLANYDLFPLTAAYFQASL